MAQLVEFAGVYMCACVYVRVYVCTLHAFILYLHATSYVLVHGLVSCTYTSSGSNSTVSKRTSYPLELILIETLRMGIPLQQVHMHKCGTSRSSCGQRTRLTEVTESGCMHCAFCMCVFLGAHTVTHTRL
jgi:hypothetical protein